MVLHGEDVLTDIFQALIGSVIHVREGRNGNIRVKALRIDRVAMVLG